MAWWMDAGRKDALAADPPGRMPPEDASAAQQLEIFAEAGLSPREFLLLCGGHTVGLWPGGRCFMRAPGTGEGRDPAAGKLADDAWLWLGGNQSAWRELCHSGP